MQLLSADIIQHLLVPSSCLVNERTGNPEKATGPIRTRSARLSTLEAAILLVVSMETVRFDCGVLLFAEEGWNCSTVKLSIERTSRLLQNLSSNGWRWRSQRRRPEVQSASVIQMLLHLK